MDWMALLVRHRDEPHPWKEASSRTGYEWVGRPNRSTRVMAARAADERRWADMVAASAPVVASVEIGLYTHRFEDSPEGCAGVVVLAW